MKKTERALRGLRRVLKPQAVTIRILLSYISILLLLFSVLAISRYYLKHNGDPLHGFWVSVIDNLSAGVIVTAFAAIFFYIVSPQISVEEELSVIDAWNINPSLRAPLETTKNYYYRGRSGRWIRSKALPEIVKAASRDGARRSVNLILPDPCAPEVMTTYADYRNSLSADKSWTKERIRNEILATIIIAAQFSYKNMFVTLSISVVNDFSVLRADLTDSGLILTRENQQLPGWYSSPNSTFYNSYLEDMRMVERRGKFLGFSDHDFSKEKVSKNNIGNILSRLGIDVQLEHHEHDHIMAIIDSNENPYD